LFDPAAADAIAHQLLVSADALGAGFEVVQEDTFDDRPAEEVLNPSVPECAAAIEIFNRTDALAAAHRAGRAERQVVANGGTADELSIEQNISIFDDEETPATAIAAFAGELDPETFVDCFTSTLLGQLPAGSTVDGSVAEPSASLPDAGHALAMSVVITTPDESAELSFETYNWQFGNAGLGLSITGAIDPAIVQATIDGLQANLLELSAQGPLPTPVEGLLYDPANAEEIAEAAMPSVEDLPVAGPWTLAGEDDFESGPFDDLADDASCAAVLDFVGPLKTAVLSATAGRSTVQYVDYDSSEEFVNGNLASVDVAILSSDAGLAEAVDGFATAYVSNEYAACVAATIREVFADAPIEPVAATVDAPEDGGAFAAVTTVQNAAGPHEIRLEFYTWRVGNAVITVQVAAPTATFSEAVVAGVIGGTVDRLAGLAE